MNWMVTHKCRVFSEFLDINLFTCSLSKITVALFLFGKAPYFCIYFLLQKCLCCCCCCICLFIHCEVVISWITWNMLRDWKSYDTYSVRSYTQANLAFHYVSKVKTKANERKVRHLSLSFYSQSSVGLTQMSVFLGQTWCQYLTSKSLFILFFRVYRRSMKTLSTVLKSELSQMTSQSMTSSMH